MGLDGLLWNEKYKLYLLSQSNLHEVATGKFTGMFCYFMACQSTKTEKVNTIVLSICDMHVE